MIKVAGSKIPKRFSIIKCPNGFIRVRERKNAIIVSVNDASTEDKEIWDNFSRNYYGFRWGFSTRTQKDQLLLTLEITFKIQIYPFLSCFSCVFGKREAFRMHGEILKDPTRWSVSVPGWIFFTVTDQKL